MVIKTPNTINNIAIGNRYKTNILRKNAINLFKLRNYTFLKEYKSRII
jgi:hypothetical protein